MSPEIELSEIWGDTIVALFQILEFPWGDSRVFNIRSRIVDLEALSPHGIDFGNLDHLGVILGHLQTP